MIRWVLDHCVKDCNNSIGSAHFIQCHVCSFQPANNQNAHLNYICVTNYFHSTKCDNDSKDCKTDHYPMKIIVATCVRQQTINRNRTEIQNRSEVYKHIKEQPEYRHDQRHRFVV